MKCKEVHSFSDGRTRLTPRIYKAHGLGAAQHRGSVRTSHPAASGSNLDAPEICLSDF